ncbi:MAG: DNA alkylation repair protein [Bacteroidales bacterium]|nr:DNA alkylation repair protein [Bacteroidales bacterium]
MASDIIEALQNLKNDEQRAILMRFFKSGPGQYGEGDQFLGLKVPEVRTIAKMSRDLPLESVPELLVNSWHEVRLCGFLILTYKMERLYTRKMARNISAISQRDEIVRLYLEYADYANNWDLVDLSAPKIVGPWLLLPSEIEDKDAIMDSLAGSPILWRQRIAMVSTWKTTQQGHPEYALRYAERLVNHDHDLIHKAVGWMLREVGKRGGMDYLEEFLKKHAATMPRTTLRYAIEQLPESDRRYWMSRKE